MGTQDMSNEKIKEIQRKINEACKNDVSHVRRICSEI